MGARFSASVQTGPGAHPASCTMGTRSFPAVKSGRGVTLTPHTPLLPWSCRAIQLYSLYRASVPVQGCTLPPIGLAVTCIFANLKWGEVLELNLF